MTKYDWKIKPRDEDWSDDTYAYFLIHINLKRMAEYLTKEFKKDWWFKADYGRDNCYIVAENNNFPVRLFFTFDEGGWADITRHYTDGATLKDDLLGSWHFAKYDFDYSYAVIRDNIENYFYKFEESMKKEKKSLKEKKNHPLTKDVKKWIVDSFSFMDAVGYGVDFDDEDSDIEEVFGIDIDGLTKEDVEKGKENLIKSVPKTIKSEFPFLTTSVKKDGNYFILYVWLLKDDSYLKDQKASYVNLNESKKSLKGNKKSIRESFEYEGGIPLDELMDILTEEWQENNTNNLLFRESSHWDDESRDENRYVEISAILDFSTPYDSGYSFSNKKIQKQYDETIEELRNEVEDDDFDDVLYEYEPILLFIVIDLKEEIIYASVDLGNGVAEDIAREKLADNEKDFRKQIQRMINAF